MEGWKDQAMRLRFHHIKSTNTGCQVSTRTFSSFPACESSDGIGSHSKVDHFGPSLAELQALPNWHTNSAYQASDQCIINIHKCFHSGETYHHQCHSTPHNPILISNSPQKPWFSTLSLYSFGIGWRQDAAMGYDHGIGQLGRPNPCALRLLPLSRAAATAWLAPLPPGTMMPVSGPCEAKDDQSDSGDKDGQAKVNSTKCRKVTEHHVICGGTGNALRSYMNTCSA